MARNLLAVLVNDCIQSLCCVWKEAQYGTHLDTVNPHSTSNRIVRQTQFRLPRRNTGQKVSLFLLRKQRVHVRQLGNTDSGQLDKRVVVDPCTEGHEKLTVHAVHDSAVTWVWIWVGKQSHKYE
jgi:hypothetical protein